MKLSGFGPEGEFRHDVELAKELADHLAGVFALTKLLHLLEDPRECVFRLGDGHGGVVLTLSLQTLVMFSEFFAVELNHRLARWPMQRSRLTWGVDGRQTALQGHRGRGYPSV
jgi:hypothetical protein